MIEIIPYNKDFVNSFVYDGIEKEILGSQIKDMLEFYNRMGSVFMGIVDCKVIGVGGIYPLWGQTGSAFLMLNKKCKEHKKEVFKILLEKMNELIKFYDIKTLTVDCANDILEAKTLISHLGFVKTQETKMSTYTRKV
jgi:hypothetical protein